MVDGALRIFILGCREPTVRSPGSAWASTTRTGHSAICGTEFDLSRASEHGHRSGLYDIQIITLDPELINAVRNLEGQRDFIRLHQFNRRKPPLERIGAEMQPDSARYFPPNPIVSLLHRCFYSHSSMARRNIFHPFRRAQTGGPKEEEHTILRPLRAKRLQAVPVEVSTTSAQPGVPDRTNQQLSGDEITSSVRSINELAQHSYSHVIRIYRRSFVSGKWRIKSPCGVSKKKVPMSS